MAQKARLLLRAYMRRCTEVRSTCESAMPRSHPRRLRKDHGVQGGVPVLLSTEKPRCQLVSLADMQNGNPLDYQVVVSHPATPRRLLHTRSAAAARCARVG
jgi:hypothetical protein